jgi:hypothetical protein
MADSARAAQLLRKVSEKATEQAPEKAPVELE